MLDSTDTIIPLPGRGHRVTDDDRPRLSRQCLRMLDLFESQPRATNGELAAIALKYTSRISDLRKNGYTVVCVTLDHKTGRAEYILANTQRACTDPAIGDIVQMPGASRHVVARGMRARSKGECIGYRTGGEGRTRWITVAGWQRWAAPALEWERRWRGALASGFIVGGAA